MVETEFDQSVKDIKDYIAIVPKNKDFQEGLLKIFDLEAKHQLYTMMILKAKHF